MLRDSLGENRDVYPMTSYLVAGTQTEKKKQNFVIFIKMSQLHQTQQEEDGMSTGRRNGYGGVILFLRVC